MYGAFGNTAAQDATRNAANHFLFVSVSSLSVEVNNHGTAARNKFQFKNKYIQWCVATNLKNDNAIANEENRKRMRASRRIDLNIEFLFFE